MELKTFETAEFGTIRTVEVDNDVWFVAKDVCEVLNHSNTSVAMQMLEDDERTKLSLGRAGETNFINESGLYTLIIKSNLPNAKKFRKWVTSEVLPSIRKNGGYIHTTEEDTPDVIMAKALLLADKTMKSQAEKIAQQAEKIEADAPKVLFADAVNASDTSILIGELAKLLKQNGVNIGQRRLFEWLRNNGYLMKGGSSYNTPTQKAMDLGLFTIKETVISHADGHITINKTSKVTGRGQQYFINKFLA